MPPRPLSPALHPAGTTRALIRIRSVRPSLLAALTGALVATGFAPLGLWPLALVALAAFLWLVESADSARGAFSRGWFFGLGHFTVGLNWIAHAFTYQDAMPHWFGYGAVVLLSLYLALFPGLAALAQMLLRRRWPALPGPALFAAIWLLSEIGRATLFTGFAWDPLGMIWLGTYVDQAARLIGTYGLSALTILVASALLALADGRERMGALGMGALALVALAGYVSVPRPQGGAARAGPLVTVVQPNIDQGDKYDPAQDEAHFETLARLTGRSAPGRPRLVFWPEAALPAWLDVEPDWRYRLAGLLGPGDLLMTGGVKPFLGAAVPGEQPDLVGAANSAWVLTPDGRLIGRYDKAHLVPYGEYLPMRWLLQPLGLSRLVPGDVDFRPGPGPRSLPLPGASAAPMGGDAQTTPAARALFGASAAPARPSGDGKAARAAAAPLARPRPPLSMGVQICYEMIFSGHVVDRAHRPAFLYNPSNDAWFGSWGPPQHLAQARMRAIEEAMPILRSTPTGISAVIDGHGRLLASVPAHRAGAITLPLPPALAPTPFARFGNLLPLALALLLLGFAVATARRNR